MKSGRPVGGDGDIGEVGIAEVVIGDEEDGGGDHLIEELALCWLV